MPSDELQVQETTAKKDFLDLFKTWKLAKLSIIQMYAWWATISLQLLVFSVTPFKIDQNKTQNSSIDKF